MDIKQRVTDAVTLLKSDRKYQLLIIGVAIGVVFVMFGGKPAPRQRRAPSPVAGEATKRTETVANKEAYQDLVTRFDESLRSLEGKVDENLGANRQQDERIAQYEERTAEIFKKILERMADQESSRGQNAAAAGPQFPGAGALPTEMNPDDMAGGVESASMGGGMGNMGSGMGSMGGGAGAMGGGIAAPQDNLEQFGEIGAAPEVPPPAPPQAERVAFIGAGDSVTVKLLAGVRAPTDGTPYPVLFKLVSNVQGPDGSSLPVGEARLVAAAQGSLTDSRVLFRLTKLSMRMPDGHRKVIDVDGWVVGEDGLRGMQGIPIDPIGKGIAAGGLVGALGAIGNAYSQQQVTRTSNIFGGQTSEITGSIGKYAAGQGIEGFTNEWGRIVAKRVNELVPHIEVYSGREGTAIFSESVGIRGLLDAMGGEDDVFAGAD